MNRQLIAGLRVGAVPDADGGRRDQHEPRTTRPPAGRSTALVFRAALAINDLVGPIARGIRNS